MSAFELPRTAMTPHICFTPAQNQLRFEGDCYPENPRTFFAPFFEALQSHFDQGRPAAFTASFHLQYVNSASTVALRRLIHVLDRVAQEGGRVLVQWEHDADDDVNEELGRDLAVECAHATIELRTHAA